MSTADDMVDRGADEAIISCLDLSSPKSFFLYAGAGSGKTRSLVEAVRTVCQAQGRRLAVSSKQIGVITYTNAACDEIRQRLEFDPRVEVSTIHSFAWSLIRGFDSDIRRWLAENLLKEVDELELLQSKGRANSKAAMDRARSIESKRARHSQLSSVVRFVYSPTGDNRTRDSLNHSEVIAMTADLLRIKGGLRRLLTSRFPILLIDESQDTNGRLMDALLAVQHSHSNSFSLGLFGDVMQRIYAEGKEGLAQAIPPDWERPRKVLNHRCPTRVIELINKIRREVDGEMQQSREHAPEGTVRMFLAQETITNPSALESRALASMAITTGDEDWRSPERVKTLALEHMMSARRFGFAAFFEPLYGNERMRTGLLDGSGRGISFFTRELLPLSKALAQNDRFAIAAAVRKTSPLLDKDALEAAGDQQRELLARAKSACDGLRILLESGPSPSLRDVVRYVAETHLFSVPEILAPFAEADPDLPQFEPADGEAEDIKSETGAWRAALDAPFEQIERYDRYVSGTSQFDTHQGVKGLEFPRVMVVINDEEARGFLFSYGKLMGIKPKTKTDLENDAAGKETSIDRTRRLFYVTCSRAEESLAIVYYCENTQQAKDSLIQRGWFHASEIEILA